MTDPLLHDLAVLHSQDKLDETALRFVIGERVAGKPLELDHLVMIFGVADIHRIVAAARSHPADRVLLRSRFDDVVEALERVEQTGSAFERVERLVTATTKGFRLLREVLCPPVVERDPVAALDAAFPATTDRGRDEA